MSRWFRFYTDAVTDPKVQSLSGDVFKTWVNLLCIAGKHDGKLPTIHELTYQLSGRKDKLDRHLNELIARGLIDVVEDHFEPHNWRERQYKSDTSAPRTKAWRDRKRDVTETVTVTAPDNRVQSTEKKEDAPSAPLLEQPSADAEVYARGREVLGKNAGGLIAKLIKSKNGNLALARAAIEQASTKNKPSEYIARIVHGATGRKVDMEDPQDVMRFILS